MRIPAQICPAITTGMWRHCSAFRLHLYLHMFSSSTIAVSRHLRLAIPLYMHLQRLCEALAQFPSVSGLSLDQITCFIRLATKLKDDILLPQPVSHPAGCPPEFLPPSIASFLSEAVDIPLDNVSICWAALKTEVWHQLATADSAEAYEQCFKEYGWQRGLSMSFPWFVWFNRPSNSVSASLTLYPPTQHCTDPDCPRRQGGSLKKEQQRQVIVYTLANGAHPAYSVHLSCPGMFNFFKSEFAH